MILATERWLCAVVWDVCRAQRASGRCLKERSSHPPTDWGYWGHRRRRECFPPFIHPSLFVLFFFSFLTHFPRKTFELLFFLYLSFLCAVFCVLLPLLCLFPNPFFRLLLPYKFLFSLRSHTSLLCLRWLSWCQPPLQCFSPCLHHDLCVSDCVRLGGFGAMASLRCYFSNWVCL